MFIGCSFKTDLAPVIRRFPTQEFTARRLCASDPEFRRLCEDYAIAICALERWTTDKAKAQDYRRIVGELEEEILEYFEIGQRLPGKTNGN